jgi:hypothetical protein
MKKTSRARKNRDAFAHYLLRPRWSRKPAKENINEELEDNDSDGRPSGHYRIRPGSRGTARESVSAARRHARYPRRGGRFGQPDSGGRAREQVVCAAASDPANATAYKRSLADFLCQGTGGPCQYTGPDIVTAHKGRGVTGEAFDAVVEDLVATLDQLKVPEKEKADLLGILGPMKMAVVQH